MVCWLMRLTRRAGRIPCRGHSFRVGNHRLNRCERIPLQRIAHVNVQAVVWSLAHRFAALPREHRQPGLHLQPRFVSGPFRVVPSLIDWQCTGLAGTLIWFGVQTCVRWMLAQMGK